MVEPDSSFTVFTDAPSLRRRLLSGSFQLLFWLFFHPTAWRSHLALVAPELRPNFCLADLGWPQWRSRDVWRLLLMSFLAWPLVAGGLIALGLWLAGQPGSVILLGIIVGLAVGTIASAAAGFAGSIVVGTAVGLAVSVVIGVGGMLAFGTVDSLVFTSPQLPVDLVAGTILGLAAGLAGGLGFGVAAGVAGSGARLQPGDSLLRQVGGVLAGVGIGAAAGRLSNLATGQLTIGMIVGIPFGVAVWLRTRRWGYSLLTGWLVAVAGSLTHVGDVTLGAGMLELLAVTAILASLFTLPYVLAERIAGPWAGAMAGALGAGSGFFLFTYPEQSFVPILLFSMAGVLLGLTLAWWRPVVMYPLLLLWNGLLLRLDERRVVQGRRSLLRLHSAFWDEAQRLRLLGLERHLLLVLTEQPAIGLAAMEYLSIGRQRWAVQQVQIELDARQLAACDSVQAIAGAHQRVVAGELAGPASALLRSFNRVSQDVDAALQQESLFNRRLTLSTVEDRLNRLLRELTSSNEPYADRFQPIAAGWRHVLAQATQRLAEETELRQEIDSPYIIGVPLTEAQEIFIGRTDISSRIEQLLLDRRRPPLLLYGQRRVGKTSLLNNLGRQRFEE
ncbi:MAG: hypothetical protein KC425_22640, partial [Anaerolineales bacterium]|nr:hypothetical protein [Anaerolineales bacterium]